MTNLPIHDGEPFIAALERASEEGNADFVAANMERLERGPLGSGIKIQNKANGGGKGDGETANIHPQGTSCRMLNAESRSTSPWGKFSI